MSRLTKYLESLMTKSDSVKDSQTTHSSYYRIQGLEIGVSDHFPEASNISCHIRIVNPLNAKTVYLVQVKEGPQILTFNLAGVKTFISNYLYVKKIQGLNREAKANNAKKNKTAKQTSKKSAPTCNINDPVEWVNFWKEVAKNIPNYKVIMTTNKKKVTYRLFKGASVSTVVEKLKTAIKAKALYAASSSNYLKEYWENL